MAQPIKPAATLVLLRPASSGGEGTEVLLMRRHGKSGFMGGVHVFPGGKVDEHDFDAGYSEVLADFDWEAARSRFRGSAEEVRAHYVAALRETFEEAGCLLASPKSAPGEVIHLENDADRKERLAGYRDHLNDREHPETLLSIARKEELLLRPDLLAYFDHWITPEIESKRYDTRFFVAAAPEGQEPTHDEHELTEWDWFRPADAIAAFTQGKIKLAPPTWVTLQRLAAYASVSSTIAGLGRRTVVTNLPRPKPKATTLTILLPGHPEYGEQVGEPVEVTADTPLGFTMAGGTWKAIESV